MKRFILSISIVLSSSVSFSIFADTIENLEGFRANFSTGVNKSIPYFTSKDDNKYIDIDFPISDLNGFTFVVFKEDYKKKYKGTIYSKKVSKNTKVSDLYFEPNIGPNEFVSLRIYDKSNKLIGGDGTQAVPFWGHRYRADKVTPDDYPYELEYSFPSKKLTCKDKDTYCYKDTYSKNGKNYTFAYGIHKANKTKNKGPIFIHVGGPGFSNIDTLKNVASFMPKELLEDFDIVAVDDIGTGYSSGGKELGECASSLDVNIDNISSDFSDNNIDNFSQSFFGKIKKSCELALNKYKEVGGTKSSIEIWEKVRQKHYPDKKINIWGMSYGGRTAVNYERTYTNNVRSIVFDSPSSPSDNLMTRWLSMSQHWWQKIIHEHKLNSEKIDEISNDVYKMGFYNKQSNGENLNLKDLYTLEYLYSQKPTSALSKVSQALKKLTDDGDSTSIKKVLKDTSKDLEKFNNGLKTVLPSLALISCNDAYNQYSDFDLKSNRINFESVPFTGRFVYSASQMCSDWDNNTVAVPPYKNEAWGVQLKRAIVIKSINDSAVPISSMNKVSNIYGHSVRHDVLLNNGAHTTAYNNSCARNEIIELFNNPKRGYQNNVYCDKKEIVKKINKNYTIGIDNEDKCYVNQTDWDSIKIKVDYLVDKMNLSSALDLDFISLTDRFMLNNKSQTITDYKRDKDFIYINIERPDSYNTCPRSELRFYL